MELQQLRLFLAAAESESFTRGAERAFVSQPALSASISKLEAEMGVKLFTRNKRNVVLTPAGRKLLKRARLIVGECAKAKDELKHHEVQRRLRIGVINTLSISHVARLVEQYRREHPDLQLDVIDASAIEMDKLEEEDKIDLALTVLPDSPRSSRKFINTHLLFTEPYVLALPLNHHLSRSSSISLSELEGEPFIARSHCEHRRVVQGLLKAHNVRLNLAYVANQDDRALALVSAEVGIAIVPQHYEVSNIVKLPLAEDQIMRSVGFEWGEGGNIDEVKQFVDFAATAPWG
ncbi:LysR family transcriptional regulator [Neptuniibacter caesariensis]|uniref:LysR family transcriptional regulatory protein n=1 Tax=Neptuniibacter caesariensis TaxID=207954 RepID=A0A7U8C4E6_NEPCE|nr:LysR substrate-binding domain-containing protein [Neptuniibacter caesariensis]EAR61307.1 LysR family transcriptional regulatory protein [Oceanospirillum sp. MED92] [Neptuniibacter caesariensis]